MIEARASILAVGTELTTGQITNRNAAWISERLVNLGVEVVLHETVPDDRAMIREALERCMGASRLIFVTGGLGPTTDDFTREVIADWTSRPLEFHEPSWTKIQSRLSRLGVPVAPSNRQQCFYPRGARVLPNTQGTADGFTLDRGEANLWVLPGPPREIETIWNECGIEADIRARLPEGIEPLMLFTWECLGKSEAELGEITEKALAGSGLQTGYRAHRPYVEVKVWVPESRVDRHQLALKRLEEAIAPWVIVRQGEDLAAQLLDLLRSSFEEIEIVDSCSGGFLQERLSAHLRKPAYRDVAAAITLAAEWASPDVPSEWVTRALAQADEEVLTLALSGITPSGEWAMGLRHGTVVRHEALKAPYGGLEFLERSRSFIVETALKRWRDWLKVSS